MVSVLNNKHAIILQLKVFLDLCGKFMPAMKYFFFENFPSAGLYIERRLAYARSVATSSMIGYILGLGKNYQKFCMTYFFLNIGSFMTPSLFWSFQLRVHKKIRMTGFELSASSVEINHQAHQCDWIIFSHRWSTRSKHFVGQPNGRDDPHWPRHCVWTGQDFADAGTDPVQADERRCRRLWAVWSWRNLQDVSCINQISRFEKILFHNCSVTIVWRLFSANYIR